MTRSALNQEREYVETIQPKIDLAKKNREKHLRAQTRRASVQQSNAKRYSEVVALWNADRDRWGAVAAAEHLHVQLLKRQYSAGEPAAVEKVISIALSRSPCPAGFPISFAVLYDATCKILAIDYLLPNLEEMTVLKPRGDKKVIVGKIEQGRLDNIVPLAVAIGVLYECFRVDYAELISSIALNGMLRFTDRATGQIRNECVLSVMTTREQMAGVDIAQVDPVKCFRALKGLMAANLKDKIPVMPVMVLNKNDRRIIPGHAVIGGMAEEQNLAMMDWEVFEHFIRELFEASLRGQGVEVKVTQSSRDRGVDAIAFDPDPLRGGKIVIQAKRYTRTVDVSSVRDLYGTVMNEGANRGIIVTTSSFGPDAYAFVKDKPLTLIDGSRLLGMLQQQGHNFRIDLEEARRVNALQN